MTQNPLARFVPRHVAAMSDLVGMLQSDPYTYEVSCTRDRIVAGRANLPSQPIEQRDRFELPRWATGGEASYSAHVSMNGHALPKKPGSFPVPLVGPQLPG